MNKRPQSPRKIVDRSRVEVAQQSICRVKWTFVGIADANVQRQLRRALQVSRDVEAMNRRSRQPTGQLRVERSLIHVTRKQPGERDASIRNGVAAGLQTS